MGDTSMIARRLMDGHIQYGWSGNWGMLASVGARLLEWYDDPDKVEYLFSLGQLQFLHKPHSEDLDRLLRNRPTGKPHWLGTSEQEIFGKIAFVDVGFFYDLDNRWYYVFPGPFRLKIPMHLMVACVDTTRYGYVEREFLHEADRLLVETIRRRYEEDEDFRAYLAGNGYDRDKFTESMEVVLRQENAQPCQSRADLLRERHPVIYGYFDDWAVVRPNKDWSAIQDVLLRKKEDKHLETLYWVSPQVKKDVKMEDVLLELDDQVLPELEKLLPSLGMTLEELVQFFYRWCTENPKLAEESLLQWQEKQQKHDKTEDMEGHDNG